MKRLAIVLLAWASPALAQVFAQPDEDPVLPAQILNWTPGEAFGVRDGSTAVYKNIRPGDPDSVYFTNTGLHFVMESISMERPGVGGQGVGTAVRINSLDIVIARELPGPPFQASVEFFESLNDWQGAQEPGDRGVAKRSLGGLGFTVDCWGAGCANYHVDLSSIGGISVPRGRCCVAVACRGTPDAPATVVFRSGAAHPGPDLGYSSDDYYVDQNGDGLFTSAERFSFGGYPLVANMAITLYSDDGCALDLNGDGFVNGDDIDLISAMIEEGCP